MKRITFAALTAVLLLMLAACGGQAAAPDPAAIQEAVDATVAAMPAPEAPAAEAPAAQAGESRLDTILARGNLICGVNGGLAGFSNLEPDGSYSGFDADFCRAVAVALFNDPEAVEFVPLSTQERFTAVQAGTVDVLFRNTTWTLSRDSSVFMDFGPTTFYDGQAIMTTVDLDIAELEGLDAATICVQSGTTTELNLTDQFRARGINFEPLVFEDIDATYTAYNEGSCDAVTSDRSQLVARRTTLADPDAHVILDTVLSKEPLGPAVAQNDSRWSDVVEWTVYATIQAEELGINSANIQEFLESENPEVRRLLGAEGDLGVGVGLDNAFAVNIISSVGNYGEIYNRNLGPDTPFNLERGQNALWTEGGLMYAPPFR
ncbi:MAG: amino acid ABC transporter substrate-binding protein [Chloroflexaceae bacterium]|nr:amino acid ABC transporter substrate-binding protein [Chloroflexaceae bacterium]NJO07407.1 amino acid ABC transporter substrate-binding protein [Chloroflexaceae bacterium]